MGFINLEKNRKNEVVISEDNKEQLKETIIKEQSPNLTTDEEDQELDSIINQALQEIEYEDNKGENTGQIAVLIDSCSRVIKNDLEHSKQYHQIANDHLEIKKENFELLKKQGSLNLKNNILWAFFGGMAVYIFPDLLPYAEKALEWIAKIRG